VTGSTRGWPEPMETGGRVGAVAQAEASMRAARTRPRRGPSVGPSVRPSVRPSVGLGALRFLSDGERDVIF
jgi:hypothetical protein